MLMLMLLLLLLLARLLAHARNSFPSNPKITKASNFRFANDAASLYVLDEGAGERARAGARVRVRLGLGLGLGLRLGVSVGRQ